MNIGIIWSHLKTDDKKLMTQAICHFGTNYRNSYCHKHKLIQWNDPRLVFLKLKPVYHALKLYRNNDMVNYSSDQDRIDKMIHIIKSVIR